MAYRNLGDFIEKLETEGELIRINHFADPVLEIPEITDRFSKTEKGGKALLFMNTGTGFPVLTNALGSDKRMAMAMGVNTIPEIEDRFNQVFNELKEPRQGFFEKLALLPKLARISGYFPSVYKAQAPCQQVILRDPDLSVFPVLKTWPYDGGRFITLPMVFTEDPETGARNVGMYRMQIYNKNSTGMHWHRHKTGASHYEKYRRLGVKMPVAVALGGDPAIIYSSTAPLPENMDEMLLAGFLRQKSVAMVPCITQDISVPAESEIILEGYVDTAEELRTEGPFGDHTGFYSLEDLYPVFHLTCITHRKNAVYPATLVGIPPQEDAWIARATERIFVMPVRQAIVPELMDMDIPEFGVAHNLTIVSIRKSYPGQAKKVMNALWGAGQMMFNKVLIVCDGTIDIHDHGQVFRKLATQLPKIDLYFSEGPLDVLDHSSSSAGFGSKLGIDLTSPFEEEIKKDVSDSSVDEISMKEFTELDRISEIAAYRVIHNQGSAVIIMVSVKKSTDAGIKKVQDKLIQTKTIHAADAILFVDEMVDLDSFYEFLWYLLNNLEPKRDIYRIKSQHKEIWMIDGTAKSFEADGMKRDWPNPVCMDVETIEKVDRNWENYGTGSFIPSPSLHYSGLIKNQGARAYINRKLP